jgi:hypothetical protein
VVASGASRPSAHRLDQYLQAARVAIGVERIHLELDLTPGVAVADAVLAEIDRDGTRTISAEEARAYAGEVGRAIEIELDQIPVPIDVVGTFVPPLEEVRTGTGTIRLQLDGRLPALAPGAHQLRYRNSHRPEISVYLANALVPESDRVEIRSQRRDVDQRGLAVDYVLDANRRAAARAWYAASIAGALLAIASLWRRSRHAIRPLRRRREC